LPVLNHREKVFLGKLITGTPPIKELVKYTPKQIINTDIPKNDTYDIGALLVCLAERQSDMTFTSRSGIPVIISDPDTQRLVTLFMVLILSITTFYVFI